MSAYNRGYSQQYRGRGAHRGRYGKRGRSSMSTTASPNPPPPFGPEIASISAKDLTKDVAVTTGEARVTNFKLVASYNWLDKRDPTIIVPGMPPRWTPLSKPSQLDEDSGIFYRDRNASRFPSHPMQPAIESILLTQTSINGVSPTPIDVVACVSTLNNLLRFASGDDTGFRMLVQVVGSTVHLIRRENSPKEIIEDVFGYGHTFPERYTTWDPEARGSASHQRILNYQFAGLQFLVRYEGDGYLPDLVDEPRIVNKGSAKAAPKSAQPSLEDLAANLASTSVSPADPTSTALKIILAGSQIPQKALFDLKTRSIKAFEVDHLAKESPRLYLSQTPNFVLAHHTRGTFDTIITRDVRSPIRDWECASAESLSRLAKLLRRILVLARARPDGRMEITRGEGDAVLRAREQTPGLPGVLSAGCEARWKAWLGGGRGGVEPKDDVGDEDDDEGVALGWAESDDDFTACTEACDYCGRCTY
ncbi:hypothetical protein ACHAQA_008510 [Verticillium albo-atrum]